MARKIPDGVLGPAQSTGWQAKNKGRPREAPCGDGVGFDVLSFDDADDGERYLEVKTTGLGKYFPFVVTENELRCSEDLTERYELYRVFDFSRRRVYVLTGALRCCRRVSSSRRFIGRWWRGNNNVRPDRAIATPL